jgi:hypothetical protein
MQWPVPSNHARELVGPVAYALITNAAIQSLSIPTDGMVSGEEAYDDTPLVRVHVLALSAISAISATAPGSG